ncbi:MAG TPA: chromate resistance protein ChrB domain-containing protein [Novimethylophilus sp.]|jgi:hypothetical protein|uniref:chromate resistance protein ChrB domain-containing protein n=1 Tax=Novimethylophilus sp. TaxID=2137426 RepID=UPI002F425911
MNHDITSPLLLIGLALTLPSHTTTPRTKAWRALKAMGAAVLRDGVYVLPASLAHEDKLSGIAAEVEQAGGTAELLSLRARDAEQSARFTALFDRSEEFAPLVAQLQALLADDALDTPAVERRLRGFRRQLEQIVAIDFFPGEAQAQAVRALADCEARLAAMASPHEPDPARKQITLLSPADYQGRLWATRARPWMDRLASAWLIARYIDANARFIWLAQPDDCPLDALGFDFDGATFSHVDGLVTFETLLASFGLNDEALARLGAVIHCLDVGGIPVPEATGLAAVLDGLRRQEADDDRLLAAALPIFDALLRHFTAD